MSGQMAARDLRREEIEEQARAALTAISAIADQETYCPNPFPLLGSEASCNDRIGFPGGSPRPCDPCITHRRLVEADMALRAAVELLLKVQP